MVFSVRHLVADLPQVFKPGSSRLRTPNSKSRSASCPNSQRVESRTASDNSTGLCNGDALRLGTSRAPVQGFNARMFRAILSPALSSISWRRGSNSGFAALGESVSIRDQRIQLNAREFFVERDAATKRHKQAPKEIGVGLFFFVSLRASLWRRGTGRNFLFQLFCLTASRVLDYQS